MYSDTSTDDGFVPRYPLSHTARHKPRRWPLVLRFMKGAIHTTILIPVFLHTLFAAGLVLLCQIFHWSPVLPSMLVPSLSLVVGLMLVFRNGTSYDRFWTGLGKLNAICACMRNLARAFLVNSFVFGKGPASQAERADTEAVVRLLLGFVYATKSHLRMQWRLRDGGDESGVKGLGSGERGYEDLLPEGVGRLEDRGLAMPVEISVLVEAYIQRGVARGWFHGPQASQLTVQLNTALAAFGSMETIRLTPIPVGYLIHIRQVLALFGAVLPFAMVTEMGWWAVLLTALVIFTLYGIEGIGQQLEDPFGYDRNDIKMDAVVEDLRVELMVLLDQWKTGGPLFKAP